jgi:hypothetical protein
LHHYKGQFIVSNTSAHLHCVISKKKNSTHSNILGTVTEGGAGVDSAVIH